MYPSSDYFDKMIKLMRSKITFFIINIPQVLVNSTMIHWVFLGQGVSVSSLVLERELKCDDVASSEPHKVSFSLPSALSCLASSL